MAWTWRKRKTLIPGVRLNFGKNGISTSIGPRGASITFGSKGTYLNTSIPGTGLYKRQKIGGSRVSTDDSGCKEGCLVWVAFGTWILLAFSIWLGFLASTTIGIIFIGVVILTHIFMAIIAKIKENEMESQSIGDDAMQEKIHTHSAIHVHNIPDLDPLFIDVALWVVKNQEGSIANVQRQFEIGYKRAIQIADQLESAGIVGPNKGPQGRDVLIQDSEELDKVLYHLQYDEK